MVKPFYEIRMVKENLDLSMALLQAVQEEKVTAKQLFRDGPEETLVAFAVDSSGPDQMELTRRAGAGQRSRELRGQLDCGHAGVQRLVPGLAIVVR